MYDTVKGSDWLGDTDAMEYLAREAPKAVYELDHYGVPFPAPMRARSISALRRPQTEFGEGPPVQRTCAAADRTGTRILHTFYGQSLKQQAEFFIEYFAIDLIITDGACTGVVCWRLEDGTIHVFNAKMTVLATGGYGRAYFSATLPTPAPAMAGVWWPARACRCRTWNSCSSTRRASMGRGALSPKVPGARAGI